MNHLPFYVALALVALNVLDVVSTALFRSVGVKEEGGFLGPIFGTEFEKVPLWKVAVLKLTVAGGLAWLAWYVPPGDTAYGAAIFMLAVAGYFLITVISNFSIYFEEKARRGDG
jgi:hypothetical protein